MDKENLINRLNEVIVSYGANRNVNEFVSNYFKKAGLNISVVKAVLSLRNKISDLNRTELITLMLGLSEILRYVDAACFEKINPSIFFKEKEINKVTDIIFNAKDEITNETIEYAPNLYLNQNLYNKEFKYKFLNLYSGATQKYYKYIFQIAYELEKQLEKDVNQFSSIEFDSLLNLYKNGSIQAVAGTVSVLKGYINFSIVEGKTKFNVAEFINGNDDLRKYININITNKKILTFNEVWDIADMCYNAQDAICFLLPFYGVKGEGNEELVNLKVNDIDYINMKLKLTRNNGHIRYIDVDERFLKVIRKATHESEYLKNNGESLSENTKIDHFIIHKNDYVIRAAAKAINEPLKPINVNARIKRLSTLWGNAYITPMSLWYSGMYHRYNLIKKEGKDFDKSDYINLCDDFGYERQYCWKIVKKIEIFESLKCS